MSDIRGRFAVSRKRTLQAGAAGRRCARSGACMRRKLGNPSQIIESRVRSAAGLIRPGAAIAKMYMTTGSASLLVSSSALTPKCVAAQHSIHQRYSAPPQQSQEREYKVFNLRSGEVVDSGRSTSFLLPKRFIGIVLCARSSSPSAASEAARLLDHFVGENQDRVGDRQPNCLRGSEIKEHVELGGLFHR